jgi:acetyl-CoA acyltransferase
MNAVVTCVEVAAVEVLLMEAVRSPLCASAASGLSAAAPTELVRQTVHAVLQRAGIETADVDRVMVECNNEISDQLEAAGGLAWPVDGQPTRVPPITTGRWCGTGQQLLHLAACGIARSLYDIVVVVGVESMHPGSPGTHNAGTLATPVPLDTWPGPYPRVLAAEMLAAKWGLGREQLDAYTVRSQKRASEVASSGEFDGEIVPISVPGDDTERLLIRDETIDPRLTVEQLRALPPTFLDPVITRQHPDIVWSITAGNSAQRAVGASAVLLMSKPRAAQLGVRPRARFHEFSVARANPALPLAAPLRATEKILASAKMSLAQVDHVEVDEEFACVPLAWCAEFSISPDLFNPRGGALALGNPRACGGLRQLTTMLGALEATGGRFGLQTMSADAGKAYASLVECG